MQVWAEEKKLENEDGKRNVEIRVSPDGKLFQYYENTWTSVEADELPFHPDGGYWSYPKISGYYRSLEECENAARAEIGWLAKCP